MIIGHIIRQRLNLCDSHVVADTIDYLEAKFFFKTDDWDGLDKWAHFANDSAVYDIRLTDDCIRKEDHLNLSAGMWKVCLHGNEFRDGEVVQRITTDEAVLYVIPTGTLDGEPFPTVPPSAGEQIIASAEAAEAGAKAAAAEARQAADEAAQYEPEVFWAEYGVTAFADVAAAYDAGKLCGVIYSGIRCFAIRSVYAAERAIEFTGTSYLNDHYMVRVTASGAWSRSNETFLTKQWDVTGHVNAESPGNKVPSAKAVYDAIQTYSDPAIEEALRKAKESGEFEGADGADGITPHVGANGNWYVGEMDTGIPAQGEPGDDYILTDADKEEIAGMIPGGGGIVTITDNGDGTYSSSHSPAEIAKMAETGAVVAAVRFDDQGIPMLLPLVGTDSISGDYFALFALTAVEDGIVSMYAAAVDTNTVELIVETANPGGGGASVEIDSTLTQAGKAADAKAVGDKIGEVSKAKADYASVPNKATVDGSTLKIQRETTTTDEAGTETTETTDLFEVELPSGGECWTIDELTAETVIANDDAVPFYDTSAKGQRKTLWSNIKAVLKTYFDGVYLKLSGGILTGKIVLPTDNQNVGFTNSGDMKIFGYGNIDSVSHLRIGDATRPVQLRGSAERPKYNDGELVLKSEFDTVMQAYIDDIAELVGGDA